MKDSGAEDADRPGSRIVGRTPAEILEVARGMDDAAAEMIEFAEENLDGVEIAEEYYTWAQLKAGGPQV